MHDEQHDVLVDALLDTIAGMNPGSRLPSEKQMMAHFHVERSVVRAALAELESIHQVRRIAGVGTFAHRRIDLRISGRHRPSFRDAARAAGAHVQTVIVARVVEPAPDLAAAAFDVAEGTDVAHLHRLSHVNDVPTTLHEEWYAPEVIPNVDVAVGAFGSATEAFEAGGYEPARALHLGTVEVAPPHVCDQLAVPAHTETWLVESIIRDRRTGRGLMVGREWSRTDMVRLVFDAGTGEDADEADPQVAAESAAHWHQNSGSGRLRVG